MSHKKENKEEDQIKQKKQKLPFWEANFRIYAIFLRDKVHSYIEGQALIIIASVIYFPTLIDSYLRISDHVEPAMDRIISFFTYINLFKFPEILTVIFIICFWMLNLISFLCFLIYFLLLFIQKKKLCDSILGDLFSFFAKKYSWVFYLPLCFYNSAVLLATKKSLET